MLLLQVLDSLLVMFTLLILFLLQIHTLFLQHFELARLVCVLLLSLWTHHWPGLWSRFDFGNMDRHLVVLLIPLVLLTSSSSICLIAFTALLFLLLLLASAKEAFNFRKE